MISHIITLYLGHSLYFIIIIIITIIMLIFYVKANGNGLHVTRY